MKQELIDLYKESLSELPVKIALVGKLRAGNSTAANYYEQNRSIKEYKLSEEINSVISQLFWRDFQEGQKMRKYYTTIGQSMRSLNEDVWLQAMLDQMAQEYYPGYVMSGYNKVLVSDVRQENEAEVLRKLGFTLIKIEAPVHIRKDRAFNSDSDFDVADLTHETELAVDNIETDYIVKNNGGLGGFYNQLEKVYQQILQKKENVVCD